MHRFCIGKAVCAAFVFCLVTMGAQAQTFTDLASFDSTTGVEPSSSLVQATDGNFYGTTAFGGANGAGCAPMGSCGGTVFKMTPGGTLTTLYAFCSLANCADGSEPLSVLQATDGNFYGTTALGGFRDAAVCQGSQQQCGTIFKITSGGTLTTLRKFRGIDGFTPNFLMQASDGDLYGATSGGGTGTSCAATGVTSGCGTVFRISTGGTFTRLYNFCSQSNCTDGATPVALMQASDGNFYGVTATGGQSGACSSHSTSFGGGCGTVFKMTPNGTLTTLHAFDNSDGSFPQGGLIQGSDGYLYGTTQLGGIHPCGTLGCGTVFRITVTGHLTTLHNFAGNPDGFEPNGVLVQATDGNFYGVTSFGGNTNQGTIFKTTPIGGLTIVHNFLDSIPRSTPEPETLMQATHGSFYGTAVLGGATQQGSVFNLTVGFSPFVDAHPGSGTVGAPVILLGNNLTGSTAVNFNGTPAAFTVVFASEITTTVPAGASTGSILVTTPSGTLSSNVAFKVTPQVLSFLPTSGPVSTSIVITGESLTGASAVSFGGVLATSFTVNSDTQITATVPTGAVSGGIAVRTAGGRGQSAASFTVTP